MSRRVFLPLGTAALAGAAFVLGWATGRHSSAKSEPAARPAPSAASVAQNRDTASAVAPVLRENSRAGVAAAIAAVHEAPDRATRLAGFAVRLRDVRPEEFPALLKALLAVRSPENSELLAMACSAWAAHDGPAAFAAARHLVTIESEHGALHAAITAWARREPAAARAALQEAGLSGLANDEMAAFVQGWASTDFEAAEAFLRSVKGSALADDDEVPAAIQKGYEAVARARLEQDPAAALAWYRGLDASLQERMRQALLLKLAAMDARLASQWLAADGAAQVGASDLQPVLRGLQLEGYDAQFAWAGSAANTETRNSALVAVVRENAHGDLVALGEWLAVRTGDPSLASAFSTYAMEVVRKSPNAAVTWALSLDNPQLRQSTLHAVVAGWIDVNPVAAREWAQRTKLVDWDALMR